MSDELIVTQLKGISTHLRKAYPLLKGDADLIDNAAARIREQAHRIEELEQRPAEFVTHNYCERPYCSLRQAETKEKAE